MGARAPRFLRLYPAATINQLLAGLWRAARVKSPECPNFLNRKDRRFDRLNGALQTVFKALRDDGVGATIKHAAVISADEEELLWSTGTIGEHTPLALQRAVFFYIGKVFCLCGGAEQRSLKLSQLKRSSDPNCCVYSEHGSKNRSGIDTQLQIKLFLCMPNQSVVHAAWCTYLMCTEVSFLSGH